MESICNRNGLTLFILGLVIGVPTYMVGVSVFGPDSLTGKGIAWLVSGAIWGLPDAVAFVCGWLKMSQVSKITQWSGGIAGLPMSLYGTLAVIGGISLIIGPDPQ